MASQWPELEDVAGFVVRTFNDRAPQVPAYSGPNMRGWPMSKTDLVGRSQEYIINDARSLFCTIIARHVKACCEGRIRGRVGSRAVARFLGKHHSVIVRSRRRAEGLIETDPAFREIYRSTLASIMEGGWTLCDIDRA